MMTSLPVEPSLQKKEERDFFGILSLRVGYRMTE